MFIVILLYLFVLGHQHLDASMNKSVLLRTIVILFLIIWLHDSFTTSLACFSDSCRTNIFVAVLFENISENFPMSFITLTVLEILRRLVQRIAYSIRSMYARS